MPRKKKSDQNGYAAVFPTRFRKLIEENKTAQEELAILLDVKRQSVSLYANGDCSPSFDSLVKIADFYHVTTDWLLGRGRDDVRKTDPTLQAACEYTGLSEKSVDNLRNYSSNPALEYLLTRDPVLLKELLENVNRYLNKTKVTFVDQTGSSDLSPELSARLFKFYAADIFSSLLPIDEKDGES